MNRKFSCLYKIEIEKHFPKFTVCKKYDEECELILQNWGWPRNLSFKNLCNPRASITGENGKKVL